MTTTSAAAAASHYLPPTKGDRRFNGLARRLTRLGLSLWGSRDLTVVGRRSGQPRSTVVNLLELDGRRFLVAPRGETDWVRNLRAAGGHGTLRVGRRTEAFVATELPDTAKPAVLRPYLQRWAFEVGKFFDGVGADAGDDQLAAIAPRHPVFELSPR
jgi:deazaflavin-dependent oxidoreductase (nitroreductase family)